MSVIFKLCEIQRKGKIVPVVN